MKLSTACLIVCATTALMLAYGLYYDLLSDYGYLGYLLKYSDDFSLTESLHVTEFYIDYVLQIAFLVFFFKLFRQKHNSG